jgi:adenylate kinase
MRLIFVGGVHGVGKSSVCSDVAKETQARHLTASALIRAERASAITMGGKEVADLSGNQDLLIRGFRRLVRDECSTSVLLDGHFVLITSTWGVQPIPVDVFRALRITELVCFVGDPDEITERLRSRDGLVVKASEISELQRRELEQAMIVSEALGLPLEKFTAFDSIALAPLVHGASTGSRGAY